MAMRLNIENGTSTSMELVLAKLTSVIMLTKAGLVLRTMNIYIYIYIHTHQTNNTYQTNGVGGCWSASSDGENVYIHGACHFNSDKFSIM